MAFRDRADAGRRLAGRLAELTGTDVVVLGLPRGGVPVAAEVAAALAAPLDVIIVRKLGVPSQPEVAMGAIGEGGVRILNDDVIRRAGVTAAQLAAVEARERAELESRAWRFRAGRPPSSLAGCTAVVVDDGIATGATARAACQVARAHGATRIVLAAPVAAPQVLEQLRSSADEIVCLEAPRRFDAVGRWYEDFRQVSDAEVSDTLDRAHRPPAAHRHPAAHRPGAA